MIIYIMIGERNLEQITIETKSNLIMISFQKPECNWKLEGISFEYSK